MQRFKIQNCQSREIKFLIEDIQNHLYNKALERMKTMTYEAHSLDDFIEIIDNHPGFIKSSWCGDAECEEKLKELRSIKSRCILENEELIDGECPVCGKKAKHTVVWGIQY